MDEVGAKIAICSLSCRYPDAGSPDELWDNLMEGRRSFRPIPPQRLAISAYAAEAIGLADSITPVLAGLLTNWRFDREAFRIPKAAFDNTDLTHWLALQLAAEAIDGIGGLERLDRSRTAVIVANTLTGEFSRASLLRLRQPFLDEVLEEALEACSAEPDAVSRIRGEFAARLKSRFPEPNEDSLAGGLANTIAGRIANHFDLKGGAYAVDGACSSSLLAVANAMALLEGGAVDAVVTGAVDLSLDPFELVGFSRNGALARGRMRVFDERSNGFWPGEGGAFSVLMRASDAHRKGLPVRAILRGWGMSTDGAGGLTRPDSEGQRLACVRAHEMAGTDPGDLGYVEAHGTGTAIGDPAEITALAALREGARVPLPVGSVKANIGHTKAAAGFAGLVKTVLSLEHGGIPPHPGCEKPHSVFEQTGGKIYPLRQAQAFDDCKPALAGVSSFGFGGINVHVVLEKAGQTRRPPAVPAFAPCELRGEQGAELFVFRGPHLAALRQQLLTLRGTAPSLSLAELADAAAMAMQDLGTGDLRLAFVACDADQLSARLDDAIAWLASDPATTEAPRHVFFGPGGPPEQIGFLFSGQAAPVRKPSSVWLARFPFLADLAQRLPGTGENIGTDTLVAQPAITFANLAALAVLERFGVKAAAATGHSLGEISALAWSGAIDAYQALDLAIMRGAVMSKHARGNGAMARLGLGVEDSAKLAAGLDYGVACVNGVSETVLSGSQTAIGLLGERARQNGAEFQLLKVSHAFHSADMDAVVAPFRAALGQTSFQRPSKNCLISTVTGQVIGKETNLDELLCMQLVQPVQFTAALDELARRASLLIELGPGSALTRLAISHGNRAFAIESQSDELTPLLEVLAAVFAAGHDLDFGLLLEQRGIRLFDIDPVALLSNPCGSCGALSRPPSSPPPPVATALPQAETVLNAPRRDQSVTSEAVLQMTLAVVAEETGLPMTAMDPDARFQSDFHLNSLAVTRIVFAVCKRLGRGTVRNPTDFAEATPAMLASQLAELTEFAQTEVLGERVGGVRRWVAPYGMVWGVCSMPEPDGIAATAWRSGPLSASEQRPVPQQGVLLDLPEVFEAQTARWLVEKIQDAVRLGIRRLAVVHSGLPVSAFFRSLFQEGGFEAIVLVDRAAVARSDERIGRLLAAAHQGFAEYRLVNGGQVEKPVFVPVSPAAMQVGMPGPSDVVLAVGCHRGIGSECAFALAANGARIVFCGRSEKVDLAALKILEQAGARGIEAWYERCDVADPVSVAGLARDLFSRGLEPTVLLFAPAVNQPALLTALTPKVVSQTLAPKTAGLSAVLANFGDGLRQVLAFGSIIGRIGLEGECHYALANALQSAIVEDFAHTHPDCRCLSLEWTVWSGAGMGERLGTIERLAAKGVDALSFDDALAAFGSHVESGSRGTFCLTGRFGQPAGLDIGISDPGCLRFVDRILVDYPGTELVVETELNAGRDPYLLDHCVYGRPVFPGVMGIEAMAQSVATLAGAHFCRHIWQVDFHRAAFVGRAGLKIRIAALRMDAEQVDAAIFSEDDGFLSPCFSARFHLASKAVGSVSASVHAEPTATEEAVDAAALYGPLFFHGQRFARLKRLCDITSRKVNAELDDCGLTAWFGGFEPDELVAGDPGVADAALHALQVAIPHRRVLPLAIGELSLTGNLSDARRIVASENWADANQYSFDIAAIDAHGLVVAKWKDVRFRAVGEIDVGLFLGSAPALCAPYLERLARERLDDETIRMVLVLDTGSSRAARRRRAIERLNLPGELVSRADGRPVLRSGHGFVGLAHSADATLAVYGSTPIACDLAEIGAAYPEMANGAGLSPEDWATAEVARKLGRMDPFGTPVGGDGATGEPIHGLTVFARTLPKLELSVAVGRELPSAPQAFAHPRRQVEVAQ